MLRLTWGPRPLITAAWQSVLLLRDTFLSHDLSRPDQFVENSVSSDRLLHCTENMVNLVGQIAERNKEVKTDFSAVDTDT